MKTEVKGLKLNYTVCGSGSPAIILHGWGADSTIMKNVVDVFKEKYKVYNLDLPGFGLSETPEKSWDTYDYEDCVTKFINHLKLDDVTLVGHSFGGSIAICMAYSRLINIKSMFLIDSAGVRNKPDVKKRLKVYGFKTMKFLINILPIFNKKKQKLINKLRRKVGSSDYKSLTGVMRNTFVKAINNDLRYMFEKILVPTVLIWGENDTATPLEDAQIMNGGIQDSRLKIIKNAGHFPFLDQKEDFTEVLMSEIRRLK